MILTVSPVSAVKAESAFQALPSTKEKIVTADCESTTLGILNLDLP